MSEGKVTVPLIMVHDDVKHVIGEATVDLDVLIKKGKISTKGLPLTEVVGTFFAFGTKKED